MLGFLLRNFHPALISLCKRLTQVMADAQLSESTDLILQNTLSVMWLFLFLVASILQVAGTMCNFVDMLYSIIDVTNAFRRRTRLSDAIQRSRNVVSDTADHGFPSVVVRSELKPLVEIFWDMHSWKLRWDAKECSCMMYVWKIAGASIVISLVAGVFQAVLTCGSIPLLPPYQKPASYLLSASLAVTLAAVVEALILLLTSWTTYLLLEDTSNVYEEVSYIVPEVCRKHKELFPEGKPTAGSSQEAVHKGPKDQRTKHDQEEDAALHLRSLNYSSVNQSKTNKAEKKAGVQHKHAMEMKSNENPKSEPTYESLKSLVEDKVRDMQKTMEEMKQDLECKMQSFVTGKVFTEGIQFLQETQADCRHELKTCITSTESRITSVKTHLDSKMSGLKEEVKSKVDQQFQDLQSAYSQQRSALDQLNEDNMEAAFTQIYSLEDQHQKFQIDLATLLSSQNTFKNVDQSQFSNLHGANERLAKRVENMRMEAGEKHGTFSREIEALKILVNRKEDEVIMLTAEVASMKEKQSALEENLRGLQESQQISKMNLSNVSAGQEAKNEAIPLAELTGSLFSEYSSDEGEDDDVPPLVRQGEDVKSPASESCKIFEHHGEPFGLYMEPDVYSQMCNELMNKNSLEKKVDALPVSGHKKSQYAKSDIESDSSEASQGWTLCK